MSTRIRGRQLLLEIDGDNIYADVTQCWLRREDQDTGVVTFKDAEEEGGAQQEYLEVHGIQSTDPESFWTKAWDHAGELVPFVYAPHGNATPTTAQPHFTGMCHLGVRPDIGGEAGRDNDFTFETRWNVEGRAVKETGV